MKYKAFFVASLMIAYLNRPLVARAQSIPDIDWLGVLRADADAPIAVADCDMPDPRGSAATVCVTIPNAPPPNSGYVLVDAVAYGDMVGDGGTEAAVPIDSGGSLGEIGSLSYSLDESGTPSL